MGGSGLAMGWLPCLSAISLCDLFIIYYTYNDYCYHYRHLKVSIGGTSTQLHNIYIYIVISI